MMQKELDAQKAAVKWGPTPRELPEMCCEELADAVSRGKRCVAARGV